MSSSNNVNVNDFVNAVHLMSQLQRPATAQLPVMPQPAALPPPVAYPSAPHGYDPYQPPLQPYGYESRVPQYGYPNPRKCVLDATVITA